MGKFPGPYLESEEYIGYFSKELRIYNRALEAIHGEVLQAKPDPQITRRYWIKRANLGHWLQWLYRSHLQPCEHMQRFTEKYTAENPTGIPAIIARHLIESDLVPQLKKFHG